MGRKNRRDNTLGNRAIKKSYFSDTQCERVVLMKHQGKDEYKTVVLTGTRDSVLEDAFYLRNGIVPGQTWEPVKQHAYHGPEDESVSAFGIA